MRYIPAVLRRIEHEAVKEAPVPGFEVVQENAVGPPLFRARQHPRVVLYLLSFNEAGAAQPRKFVR